MTTLLTSRKAWKCNIMAEKRIDPFFAELMTKALAGESSKFELISSLPMRAVTKDFLSGTKKIIKLFKSLVKSSEKAYSEQIKEGKQHLDLLLAHIQFKTCLEFYEKEAATAKDMLKEYHAYVFGGNLMKTICGIPRAEKDMVDYRTLPWSLF